MKAVVYDRYGPPDVLHVEDVPIPSPASDQVRVKVAATSVNLSDWECLRGSPAYARVGGLRFPARRTLGSDLAGVGDDVGKGVTRFLPGDEVYGDNLALMGGFAEYALAPESALALKPVQLTFAEASTIPQAGAIALQGMGKAVTGNRVLINGAGGGSGCFAIQLAKRLGAHVTGVDNAAKQDFMRSVGRSTRSPPRLIMSVKDILSGKLLSTSPDAIPTRLGVRNVSPSSRAWSTLSFSPVGSGYISLDHL